MPRKTGIGERGRYPGLGRETAFEVVSNALVVAGKDRHQRHALVHGRDQRVRLQDELIRGHAADFFERIERMAQVIEHAGAEYEIESADRRRIEIVRVDAAVFDVTVEGRARGPEG